MLRAFGHRVATCWVLAQVWKWSNLGQQRPTCRNTSQQGGQTRATCCTQQCSDVLLRHVVIVWSGLKAKYESPLQPGMPEANTCLWHPAFSFIQTRLASLGLYLVWSPLNLWPFFEWCLIVIFIFGQSFNGVLYLFLYLFLVQGIHGPINTTDFLLCHTIQCTLSLHDTYPRCNTQRNKHMPDLRLSPTRRFWTCGVVKLFIRLSFIFVSC